MEKILRRMMINTELISYNNDLEFLIFGNERKVMINSFSIFNNPVFSAFNAQNGIIIGSSGLQGVELTKDRIQTLKCFTDRLLKEIAKEMAEKVTEVTIVNIEYVLEFHNVLKALEYYKNNRITVYYQEGI